MKKPKADNNRTRPRRIYSVTRVAGFGVVLFVAFGILGVLLNLLLSRFMAPEQAIVLAFAACIGAGVVMAVWGMEGVIELHHSHVHNHLRKVLSAGNAENAAASRAGSPSKGKK